MTIETEAEPAANVYDTDEYRNLYADIMADPASDDRRRKLADYLDRFDPPRGEFIRLQLQTAVGDRLTYRDMVRERQLRAAGSRPSDADLAKMNRRMDLYLRRTEREVELYTAHAQRWYPDLPVGLLHRPPRKFEKVYGILHRGFVGEIVVPTMLDWIDVGADLVRLHPITTVTIYMGDDGNPLGHRLRKPEREKLRRTTSDSAIQIARRMAGLK